MEYYIVDGELRHAGVKGMKWGVRRYQNKDGSLTPAGRIRYGAGKAADGIKKAVKGAAENHKAKRANEKESKRIEALMKKPVNKLTDAELAERTARAKKQKELRDVESQSAKLANDAKSFAKKFGSRMLNDALVPAAVNAGKNVVEKLLTKKLSDALGVSEKDTSNALDALKKVGGDFDKLTDKQAKDLAEREKNINTARQQREQRERVGGSDDNSSNQNKTNDDNSSKDTSTKSQSNTGNGSKKKNKKKSASNNTSAGKSKAVEPDSVRRESTSKTGKKGIKWEKKKVVELTDDDVVVRRSSIELTPMVVSKTKNTQQYRLGQSHVNRLLAPEKDED